MYSQIEHVFVEESIHDSQEAGKILDGINKDYTIINDIHNIDRTILKSKKILVLAEQKGRYLKKCPGTPKYKCCVYFVIELAVGCPFDCTYCFLQEYQNYSAMIIYLNFDKLYKEFDDLLSNNPNKLFRIGTGEYSDSLFLNEFINYTQNISSYLAKKYKNYIIEFKTKSNSIDNLINSPVYGREVVSWTISPDCVVKDEEKLTASLEERLLSAQRCAKKGYYIGIHLDPLIMFDNCFDEYKDMIGKLYDKIPKELIIWISIGSLRFNPRLKPIIEMRHKESDIIYGEMGRGADGKFRYIKSIRLELYKKIVGYIKAKHKDAFIYFCMEDSEVWEKVLGKKIHSNADINKLFCNRWYELTGQKLS
ncbi:radical SAM protein [bacterium]